MHQIGVRLSEGLHSGLIAMKPESIELKGILNIVQYKMAVKLNSYILFENPEILLIGSLDAN